MKIKPLQFEIERHHLFEEDTYRSNCYFGEYKIIHQKDLDEYSCQFLESEQDDYVENWTDVGEEPYESVIHCMKICQKDFEERANEILSELVEKKK